MDEEAQIIEKSPFVKDIDSTEGFFWSLEAKDPATNQTVAASISPYALLNSLGEDRGEEELFTCGCGVAECARICHERFVRTEAYIRWSFVGSGTAYARSFDRIAYEVGAIEMLHDIYVTRVGWRFNAMEYDSYEDFKVDVDRFLAAKPRFKAMWDAIEERQPCA